MSNPLIPPPEAMDGFGSDVDSSFDDGDPSVVEGGCAGADFFEVLVVDEDGGPVADLEFELTLADGTRHRGRLDALGMGRIEGIAPGEASIEFLPSEGGAAVEHAAD